MTDRQRARAEREIAVFKTTTAVVVVIVGFLTWASIYGWQERQRYETAAAARSERISELQTEIDGLLESVATLEAGREERGQVIDQLQAQLAGLGEDPVVDEPGDQVGPEPEETASGPVVPLVGPQGPPPSDAQVRAAVTVYCSIRSMCQGPRGFPGSMPTADQIESAVAAYCSSGVCRGPAGEDGRSIVGPAGPGPTDTQIAEAVAAYCGGGACQGPAGESIVGPVGPVGPQGEPGPGIVNGAVCFTFTDGTEYRWRRRTVDTAAGTEVVVLCAATS